MVRLNNAGRLSWRAIAAGAIRTPTRLRPTAPQKIGAPESTVRARNRRSRPLLLSLDPVANFVENEIAEALAAIAQNLQHALVDEIGQQNRVPRLYAIVHGIGGVPGVVTDRKCVTAVGRKAHLRLLRQRAVGKLLMSETSVL